MQSYVTFKKMTSIKSTMTIYYINNLVKDDNLVMDFQSFNLIYNYNSVSVRVSVRRDSSAF
jgi:hypothetical protein